MPTHETMPAARADTCIHPQPCPGACNPVAIVDPAVLAAARAFKRAHWYAVPDVGYGESDPVDPGTPLHAPLLEAYRAAAGDTHSEHVWLRTADYRPETFVANPAHQQWLARFAALTSVEQRRAMREREPVPSRGHIEPRRGDLLGFLELTFDGRLRFVG